MVRGNFLDAFTWMNCYSVSAGNQRGGVADAV